MDRGQWANLARMPGLHPTVHFFFLYILFMLFLLFRLCTAFVDCSGLGPI